MTGPEIVAIRAQVGAIHRKTVTLIAALEALDGEALLDSDIAEAYDHANQAERAMETALSRAKNPELWGE